MKALMLTSIAVASICAGCYSPFGYPYFWDRPKLRPTTSELVGGYRVRRFYPSEDTLNGATFDKNASIELNADHTAGMDHVPDFGLSEGVLACRYSGQAHWELSKNQDNWVVYLTPETPPRIKQPSPNADLPACSGWYLLVLGRKAPFRLYDRLGDPDSGIGIEYARQAP